ncbi:MAG: hypothetical protein IKO61_04670 [Lachnospiraceae bacterium]|nr:hypothetical protein [Lachnospiraceae bacterium]
MYGLQGKETTKIILYADKNIANNLMNIYRILKVMCIDGRVDSKYEELLSMFAKENEKVFKCVQDYIMQASESVFSYDERLISDYTEKLRELNKNKIKRLL